MDNIFEFLKKHRLKAIFVTVGVVASAAFACNYMPINYWFDWLSALEILNSASSLLVVLGSASAALSLLLRYLNKSGGSRAGRGATPQTSQRSPASDTSADGVESEDDETTVADDDEATQDFSSDDYFMFLKDNIEEELFHLKRTSSLNLSLGALFVFGAILFLGFTLLDPGVSKDLIVAEEKFPIIFVITKITFSVSVGVFGYFFLATYRRNLSEMRYYRNELTNIVTIAHALHEAKITKRAALVDFVVKRMAQSERNFVLKKGETTTEALLRDMERKENETIVAAATQVLSASFGDKGTTSKK